MNRDFSIILFVFLLFPAEGMHAQNVNYIYNVDLIENEILESKNRYLHFTKAKHEILLIDYYQQNDTTYYRITSSINALEILSMKPCAYITEPDLMTYIYCDDNIKIADTLLLGKVFDQSLQALGLPQLSINWKENAYYDCRFLYEITTIFDPLFIEYYYFKGRFLGHRFQHKKYYKRIQPKCIFTGKYEEDRCGCR